MSRRLGSRLNRRWTSGLLAGAVVTGLSAALLSVASPALATDVPGLAAIELTGKVVPVQVEAGPGREGAQQTLLRLPDGQLTPVTGLDDLASGSAVHLTADIPRALEDDVQDQAGRTALDDARDRPAAPASAVATASTDAAAARNVPLRTISVDRVTPAAQPAAPAVRSAAARATAAAAPAAQSLTIAAVGVDGDSASAYTDSVISSMVISASSYWSGQSNGAITFTQSGSTTRYTSTQSCSNSSALWNEGVSKTGFVAGANKHLVLLVPNDAYDSGDCSYGLGTIGSSVTSGGQVYVADVSWPALSHELGHNMSLWHANELTCGTSASDSAFDSSGDPTAAGCSVTEYGDGMDVMGASAPTNTGGLSSVGLTKLGIMPSSQIQAITATGATSATLIPLSDGPAASGIRSVVVTDPRNNNVYFLEDRQHSGQDTYGWQGIGNQTYMGQTTGYGLRVLKRGEDGASVVLDASPSASGSFDPDVVVKPGSTFLTASGGIQINTVQNSNGSVTVTIDLAAAGQNHGTTPGSPAATVTTLSVPSRMLVGTPYTISGTVSGSGTPAGSVSLQIGTNTQTLPLSGGSFSVAYTPTSSGELDVDASYAGNTGFAASSDSATSDVVDQKSDADISATAPAISGGATSARVDVEVTADGEPASGTVRIVDENAADVGGGSLNSLGQVRVSLPVPRPGRHVYSATFSGDSTVNGGSQNFTVSMGKYTSRVRAALASSTITRKRSTYVSVTVQSSGTDPATGVVKLVSSKDSVVSAVRLSNGKAKLIVPKGMTAGQQTLRVMYYGSSTVSAAASPPMTIRINR